MKLSEQIAPYADTLVTIAAAHRVQPLDVLGRGRRRDVTAARRAFMAALRDEGLTLQEIADLTGRTHTTVLDHVSEARRAKARRYAATRRRTLPGRVRAALAAMRVC